MTRKRSPRPSLEQRLEALGEVRDDPDSPATVQRLRKSLALKENILVAKAARLTAEFGHSNLVGEMQEAFERFLERPVETDSQCLAKNALAMACLELDSPVPDLFRRGMRHVQMEPVWGGQTDTAIELRANCALGFAQTGGSTLELLPLLLDSGLPVRLATAQALGATATSAAEAALRLKALQGDPEPEMLTQCCLELLRLSPRTSLAFLDDLLDDAEPAQRGAIALALGESRLEEGVERLREMLIEAYEPDQRRMILLALVTSRQEAALDLLIEKVRAGAAQTASEALEALGVLRGDERIRRRVIAALDENPKKDVLMTRFRREFA